jgi:L,D-transpeptidase catalytic domain
VWIRPAPDASFEWIGYLWTGGSVRLKSTKPRYGPGCNTWYAIEPQGYVCVDGERATLDADDPVYKAIRPYAPKLDSAWPHRYGESTGTELTTLLPNAPIALPALPISIHEPRLALNRHSTVAYSAEGTANGRDVLLSADYLWLPKAKVTPYPVSEFHGVKLGSEAHLPLAFFRGGERPRYRRLDNGQFEATQSNFARLSFVELGSESATTGNDHFIRTQGGSDWVKESDAVIPAPRAKTPWGADVGAPDTTGNAPKGRGTWIEIAVMQGFLIAYEGTQPIFVTLISPGRGGFARVNADAVPHAQTPLGSFPISGKFATATMVAPGDFIHSDVPWTQNFSGPHALHSAYWHDDWGNRKSGGCINVSPLDGRYLFEFTDPPVPKGWHAVRWLPQQGPATTVVIHR